MLGSLNPIDSLPGAYPAFDLIGAPRPMKMGTIASLWRYDAAVEDAPPQDDMRRPAILRYAHNGRQFSVRRGPSSDDLHGGRWINSMIRREDLPTAAEPNRQARTGCPIPNRFPSLSWNHAPRSPAPLLG
jgi:hypothetical protein